MIEKIKLEGLLSDPFGKYSLRYALEKLLKKQNEMIDKLNQSHEDKKDKTTKLDEAREYAFKIHEWCDKTKRYIEKIRLGKFQELFESAIQEIVRQKDEVIKEIITAFNNLDDFNDELLEKIKQQKPQINDLPKKNKCLNCKYLDVSIIAFPCNPCDNFSNWEPKNDR